jgi:hypothetical protein
MERSHRIMRSGRTAVVLLVLGGVTSVGVAWGLAAWLPHRGWSETWFTRPPSPTGVFLHVTRYDTVGALRRTWVCQRAGDDILPFTTRAIDTDWRKATRLTSISASGWPRWGTTADAEAAPTEGYSECLEHATGWPVLAGWYEFRASHSTQLPRVTGGIDLSPESPQYWEALSVRALPLRPIWPGLAADTAFYAGAWWLLLLAPGRLRRTLRRRRGRCTRCGYDRAGLTPGAPCPECGGEPAASQGPGCCASING